MNKIYVVLLLILINSSCAQRYKRSGFLVLQSEISAGPIKQPLMPDKFLIINEDDYVIEFREKFKGLNGDLQVTDTLSVFLIDLNKQSYAEYKKMDINMKPFLRDKIENKKAGLTIYSPGEDFFNEVKDVTIKDSIINKVKYKYVTGSRETDDGKLFYEAYVAKEPKNFPVQISKVLSQRTDGGFVEKINIFDKKNQKTITFKFKFESKALPARLEELIKVWKEN